MKLSRMVQVLYLLLLRKINLYVNMEDLQEILNCLKSILNNFIEMYEKKN